MSHGTSRDLKRDNKRDGLGMTAMAASMHSSRERFGDFKSRKETGYILVPISSKIWLSRVICVFNDYEWDNYRFDMYYGYTCPLNTIV